MDKKISALNAVSSLTGTELLPVVQSGITKKATINQVQVLVYSGLTSGYLPYSNGSILIDSGVYTSSGNVMIGGTTAVGKFTTETTGGAAYGVSHTHGTVQITTYSDGSAGWFGTKSNHPFYIFTNDGQAQLGFYQDGSVRVMQETANRAVYFDNVCRLKSSSVTDIELGYLSGANSNIQNQINNLMIGVGGWKTAARVLVDSNVTISSPGASLDGIALSVGDRVVLNGQTSGSENGVYDWNGAAVPMTRSADCTTGDNSNTGVLGMVITIEEGTYADQMWMLTNNAPITVGTTSLSFSKTSATTYTGSTGVTLVSNDFRIDNTWFSGDVTVSNAGVTTIGAGKVTNTMIAAMTSAQLAAIVSDPTGSGALVFGTSPTLTTPTIITATETMGDADKTFSAGKTEVQLTSTLTAPRALTLPAASAFATGTKLRFTDVAGGISYTNYVTLTRAGADTINGATTKTLNVVYGVYEFVTDGTSKWTVNVLTSYLENTYATTHTGFSTDPTATMYYFLNGNMCTVLYQPTVNGTSNAATFTLTLPFNAHASMANLAIPVRVFDNGNAATGRVVFASGSNILTIHPSITGTSWTASGTKAVSLAITFRIA
jgi:hypothetical protein